VLPLRLQNKGTAAPIHKNKSHIQREKSSSVKVTGICTRGKIKFAVKRGLEANLEREASTPFSPVLPNLFQFATHF